MKNKFNDLHNLPQPSRYMDSYIPLSEKRIIFMKEDFTKKVAGEICSLLLYYDNLSNEDITIYINSNGGDAFALLQIFDVMNMLKSKVNTVVLGKAYSAGAILLSAGHKRAALKHAEIMIHGIQTIFPIIGEDSKDSKEYLDYVKNINSTVMQIISDSTKHKLEKVLADFKHDVYFSAKQALDYGIIDEII